MISAAVYTLLGEVTDIGTNPHAWRGHVLERLCQLTDGRMGITLELHNLLLNRSPISIDPIDIGFGGPVERLVFVRYMASDARAVDPSTVAICTFQPQRRFLTVRTSGNRRKRPVVRFTNDQRGAAEFERGPFPLLNLPPESFRFDDGLHPLQKLGRRAV